MTMKISLKRPRGSGATAGPGAPVKRADTERRPDALSLRPLRPLAAAALALLVSGCMVGPDYHRPPVNVPATFSELPGWTQAEPVAAGPEGRLVDRASTIR